MRLTIKICTVLNNCRSSHIAKTIEIAMNHHLSLVFGEVGMLQQINRPFSLFVYL